MELAGVFGAPRLRNPLRRKRQRPVKGTIRPFFQKNLFVRAVPANLSS
jgi:hypothetical protein